MAPKLEAKRRVAAQIKAKSVTSAKPAKRLKKLNPSVSPPSSPAASSSPPCQDIEAVVPVSFSQAELDEARQKLLAWYDVNHRILPWRRNSSSQRPVDGTEEGGAPPELPQQQFIYFVWVSEVMSQQTQVPRAAEYFRRWVAKWPTVANLAAATEGEVNEMWAGLGYYRRARFLLAGAHYIVNDCDGVFPTTALDLKKIPGVGAYTGNAIASIACHEPVAVVDANVVRVVSRLRKLAADPRTKASIVNQTAGADALLDPQRPGDFNQAVMELGATVCTVHQPPSCASCPLRGVCQAYADVLRSPARAVPVTSYPAKVEKAKKREETAAVAVLELMLPGGPSRSKFLLLQRPKEGLLAGLWEFPLKLVDTDASRSQCKQQIEELLEGVLGQALAAEHVVERRVLGEITHIFTHIRLTMRVEHIKIKGDFSTDDREAVEADGTAAVRWLSRADVEAEGLSSGVRKVFDLASKAAKGEKQGIKRFFTKA